MQPGSVLSAIYWHETVRAVFAMFHGFLAGAVGEDDEKIIKLVEALQNCGTEYDALHGVILPMLKAAESSDQLWPLMRLHFNPSFSDIYRPVKTFSFDDPINPKLSSSSNVFNLIVGEPSSTKTVPINRTQVRNLVQSFRAAYNEKKANAGSFEVLVDVPWGKNASRMVQVVDPDGEEPKPITSVSHLSGTIFTNLTAYSNPIRVFVSPRLYSGYAQELGSIVSSALERFFSSKVL